MAATCRHYKLSQLSRVHFQVCLFELQCHIFISLDTYLFLNKRSLISISIDDISLSIMPFDSMYELYEYVEKCALAALC